LTAPTSPCTKSGTGRTRYQIDRLAMTATTTPTMIAGTRVCDEFGGSRD